MIPVTAFVTRFQADLDALIAPGAKLGVAVSGGPDSLALLLLAAAARPAMIEAATVDHGLRREARTEADMVGSVCARIEVPHYILGVAVGSGASVQAQAREARYEALAHWAADRGLSAVLTAHHLDDQAETLLMRVARGSGVGGLAGVQPSRALADGVQLLRPLLTWRREELGRIAEDAGLRPAHDPSNCDVRFDRTRARHLLASVDWLDPQRLAQVCANAADADEALDWAARQAFEQRARREDGVITLNPAGLPRELRRRLLLAAISDLAGEQPRGPPLMQVLCALERGETTTLAGLKLEGGASWRLSSAPPRKQRSFTA